MENMTRRELIEQLGQTIGKKDEEINDNRVEYVAGANALKINETAVIHDDRENIEKYREKTLEEQLEEAILQRCGKERSAMI